MTINDINIAIDSVGQLDVALTNTEELNLSVDSTNSLSFDVALGTGTGTTNYEALLNKPKIENVTLIGNKSFENLGLAAITTSDLLEILS